eukprot:15443298-Alexandrium_andersonii.AAC.1
MRVPPVLRNRASTSARAHHSARACPPFMPAMHERASSALRLGTKYRASIGTRAQAAEDVWHPRTYLRPRLQVQRAGHASPPALGHAPAPAHAHHGACACTVFMPAYSRA